MDAVRLQTLMEQKQFEDFYVKKYIYCLSRIRYKPLKKLDLYTHPLFSSILRNQAWTRQTPLR